VSKKEVLPRGGNTLFTREMAKLFYGPWTQQKCVHSPRTLFITWTPRSANREGDFLKRNVCVCVCHDVVQVSSVLQVCKYVCTLIRCMYVILCMYVLEHTLPPPPMCMNLFYSAHTSRKVVMCDRYKYMFAPPTHSLSMWEAEQKKEKRVCSLCVH